MIKFNTNNLAVKPKNTTDHYIPGRDTTYHICLETIDPALNFLRKPLWINLGFEVNNQAVVTLRNSINNKANNHG